MYKESNITFKQLNISKVCNWRGGGYIAPQTLQDGSLVVSCLDINANYNNIVIVDINSGNTTKILKYKNSILVDKCYSN